MSTEVWFPLISRVGGRSRLIISSQLIYCRADTFFDGTDIVLKGGGRGGGGGGDGGGGEERGEG